MFVIEVPIAIELTCNSQSQDAGIYVKSDKKGDSTCDCWNKIDGSYSIGSFPISPTKKRWMVFLEPNCPAKIGNEGANIGPANGCNPTESSCIKKVEDITVLPCDVSMGPLVGTYTDSPKTGKSTCGCWNKVDGNTLSVGKYGDEWVVFNGLNCDPSNKEIVQSLGNVSGCDPSKAKNCMKWGN
ncbi:MAG: hypothetical protein AAGJ18_09440 [Bacteroidota bacterium]